MRKKYFRVFLLVIAVAVVLAVGSNAALAQCAMCKAVLENSADSAEATKGMNLAALVLLFPPVTLFSGLFYAIYRFRNIQGGKERKF
ncbi:MAG TPA: hypothetical protein VKM94_11485 [Blastocatellia bacterium]|nr:hypothetical protein [Blastocatellia bacterium]